MNNKGVSAIVGVVLMILITLAISATVYVYVDSFIHQTQEQQDFLTKCFKESNWNLPKNTTINSEKRKETCYGYHDTGAGQEALRNG